MIYINDQNFHIEEETVVTFGKFDGVHRGHQLLIRTAVELAKEKGYKSVVCTFDMQHWKNGIAENKQKLTTSEERAALCEDLGVDCLYEYPFDDALADTEPLDFLERFVRDKLHAKAVVVGTDWHFGSHRGGDVSLLKASQKLYGFEAVIVEKELYHNREISSTWIRSEVNVGNMENANLLLGYPYSVHGTVERGHRLGSKLSCPTINLAPPADKALPPFGVYTSKVYIDGRELYGVTNVGTRPTVSDSGRISVETNILNFSDEIYGEEIRVALMHFERPEMKFEDVKALQTQLEKDVAFAKNYFNIEAE